MSLKRIHDVWAKRAAADTLTVCTIEGLLIQETDQLLLTASGNNGISWSHGRPRSHLDTISNAQPLNIQQISLPSRALCYRPVDYNSDFTPPAGSCIVTQSARLLECQQDIRGCVKQAVGQIRLKVHLFLIFGFCKWYGLIPSKQLEYSLYFRRQ